MSGPEFLCHWRIASNFACENVGNIRCISFTCDHGLERRLDLTLHEQIEVNASEERMVHDFLHTRRTRTQSLGRVTTQELQNIQSETMHHFNRVNRSHSFELTAVRRSLASSEKACVKTTSRCRMLWNMRLRLRSKNGVCTNTYIHVSTLHTQHTRKEYSNAPGQSSFRTTGYRIPTNPQLCRTADP